MATEKHLVEHKDVVVYLAADFHFVIDDRAFWRRFTNDEAAAEAKQFARVRDMIRPGQLFEVDPLVLAEDRDVHDGLIEAELGPQLERAIGQPYDLRMSDGNRVALVPLVVDSAFAVVHAPLNHVGADFFGQVDVVRRRLPGPKLRPYLAVQQPAGHRHPEKYDSETEQTWRHTRLRAARQDTRSLYRPRGSVAKDISGLGERGV
jgi:hypothetical protein